SKRSTHHIPGGQKLGSFLQQVERYPNMAKNRMLVEKGFLSSSRNDFTFNRFSGEIEIQGIEGRYIDHISSQYDKENEILHQNDSIFYFGGLKDGTNVPRFIEISKSRWRDSASELFSNDSTKPRV
ncbi:hypothetical protein OAB57_03840, partial [Bacteriovoracaceae bacterium]|nr:hypothetical protein [Bacteriovoracaceae bacterium]